MVILICSYYLCFMTYQTTITRKGQLTIPKGLRDALGLELGRRVILEQEKHSRRIKITAVPSLGSLAGSFHAKTPRHPVTLRKRMERHYKRV